MTASLFFASSVAFRDPMAAWMHKAPVQGAPKPLSPWCRRSGLNGGHWPEGASEGRASTRTRPLNGILRSDGVVVASACGTPPRLAERNGGWR